MLLTGLQIIFSDNTFVSTVTESSLKNSVSNFLMTVLQSAPLDYWSLSFADRLLLSASALKYLCLTFTLENMIVLS